MPSRRNVNKIGTMLGIFPIREMMVEISAALTVGKFRSGTE